MAVEQEVVIYAKVTNPQGFSEARQIVHQEQAQIKAPNGRIRVRKERNDKAVNWKYTLTTKSNYQNGELQTSEEETSRINESVYNQFFNVCDTFFRKTRYLFKIEKLKIKSKKIDAEVEISDVMWEVDRFIKSDGSYSHWVKIDVEVQSLKEKLQEIGLDPDVILELGLQVTSLPLGLQSIYHDDGGDDKKMRELTDLIYETQFIRKNDQAAPAEAEA